MNFLKKFIKKNAKNDDEPNVVPQPNIVPVVPLPLDLTDLNIFSLKEDPEKPPTGQTGPTGQIGSILYCKYDEYVQVEQPLIVSIFIGPDLR